LILHGTADSQIPVENGYWLKETAGENVVLSVIDGADPLVFSEDGMSDTLEDVQYRQQILSFLDTVMNPVVD
jgi:hypothetical protein